MHQARDLLHKFVARDTPLSGEDAAAVQAEYGQRLATLSRAVADSDPSLPTTLLEVATFPELAEARIALARGIAMEQEPEGASGTWYCFDRRGTGGDASHRIGVFKPCDQDYVPDAASRKRIHEDPATNHPQVDRIRQMEGDTARHLERAAAEGRYSYLGTRMGEGPAKEVLAAELGKALGVPQTAWVKLDGVQGSFQRYVPGLHALVDHPEVLRDFSSRASLIPWIQATFAFYGCIGQEDASEFFLVLDEDGGRRWVVLDHNKTLTDLMLTFGEAYFFFGLMPNREIRHELWSIMALPTASEAESLIDRIPFGAAREICRQWLGDSLDQRCVAEMELRTALFEACRAQGLSIWEFLRLTGEPLRQLWFRERDAAAERAPLPDTASGAWPRFVTERLTEPLAALAAQRAQELAALPAPYCGPLPISFRGIFEDLMQEWLARPNDAEEPLCPFFLEDLGLYPIRFPKGLLDPALFEDETVASEDELDDRRLAAVRKALSALAPQGVAPSAWLNALSRLLGSAPLTAVQRSFASGASPLAWPDGSTVVTESADPQTDRLGFRLRCRETGVAVAMTFSRRCGILTDPTESQVCEVDPRVSRLILSLNFELSLESEGLVMRLVTSPDCQFSFAPAENRAELNTWR
ncbi:hypothetical protein SCOR_08935 [Sulfidibacter corallicola]|uniref:Uncharacterized protein n=1 Tax=Sulfidibacter corallicola TaxID=2818388 RepID=A0A8A4TQ56_SULCO|nr:hypothetical protein [Sulfidibacter corallicola]QTD51118.1 hypothetical protein J3U87_01500 [Sulfidibacter corallicola]